ncbi:MAG: hypothetical protein QM747_14845 [Nocardioides sp.]
MAANLRPLIALTRDGIPHVRVVIDGEESLEAATDPPGPGPGFASTGRAGVVTGGGRPLAGLLGDRWLVVDVVGVAGREDEDSVPFADVVDLMAADPDYPDARWTLVDIASLQRAAGFVPFQEPDALDRPAIHAYLPTSRDLRPYASRNTLTGDLSRVVLDAERSGAHHGIVLQAPQGFGKSHLALHLAGQADHNAGWFLAADNRQTLITSLARAEREEQTTQGPLLEEDGEKPDLHEDTSLASAALTRLRESNAPWVVVVDNANLAPEDSDGIAGLLPEPSSPGQVLILTTTHDAWLTWAEGRHWLSPPIPGVDTHDLAAMGLPAWCEPFVNGRPLIAESLAALLQDRVRGEVPDEESGPDLVWALFRDGRGARRLPERGPTGRLGPARRGHR